MTDQSVVLVLVLDAGTAGGGGGPSGPGLLWGGGAAAAGLREPAPVRSGSCPAAVSAPAGLHHRDPPQPVSCPPAGPPEPAGRRGPSDQPGGTHHFPWPGSAGLLPGAEPELLQEGPNQFVTFPHCMLEAGLHVWLHPPRQTASAWKKKQQLEDDAAHHLFKQSLPNNMNSHYFLICWVSQWLKGSQAAANEEWTRLT